MFSKLRFFIANWDKIRPHMRDAMRNSFNQTQFWVGTAFGLAGYVLGHSLGWFWFH